MFDNLARKAESHTGHLLVALVVAVVLLYVVLFLMFVFGVSSLVQLRSAVTEGMSDVTAPGITAGWVTSSPGLRRAAIQSSVDRDYNQCGTDGGGVNCLPDEIDYDDEEEFLGGRESPVFNATDTWRASLKEGRMSRAGRIAALEKAMEEDSKEKFENDTESALESIIR